MKIAGGELAAGEEVAEVGQSIRHEVDDIALAFDVSVGLEEAGVAGGGAVFVVDVGADDEVGDAGFVFEGDEDDAGGGAGTLADEDEAGDFGPLAVAEVGEVGRGGDVEGLELGAE